MWVVDLTSVRLLFGLIDVRIGAVLDAFTRTIVAIRAHIGEPDAAWTCGLLRTAVRNARAKPRYVVTDHGVQFTSQLCKAFLRGRGVRHRYGAVGSSAALMLLERAWRSLKEEFIRHLPLWLSPSSLERRVRAWTEWHAKHRPHQGLGGKTPEDVRRCRPSRRPLKIGSADRWILERRDLRNEPLCPVYTLRRAS